MRLGGKRVAQLIILQCSFYEIISDQQWTFEFLGPWLKCPKLIHYSKGRENNADFNSLITLNPFLHQVATWQCQGKKSWTSASVLYIPTYYPDESFLKTWCNHLNGIWSFPLNVLCAVSEKKKRTVVCKVVTTWIICPGNWMPIQQYSHKFPFSDIIHSWAANCVSCEYDEVSWDVPGHNNNCRHHLVRSKRTKSKLMVS